MQQAFLTNSYPCIINTNCIATSSHELRIPLKVNTNFRFKAVYPTACMIIRLTPTKRKDIYNASSDSSGVAKSQLCHTKLI